MNKILNNLIIFKNDLISTIKLYSLTIILPVLTTLILIIISILGLNSELIYGFWGTLKFLWIDYYITGHIGIVSAWRIHIVVFIFCYIITLFAKIKE